MMKQLTVLLAFLTTAACPLLGQDYDKGLSLFDSGDDTAAVEEWIPLAESGHKQAQRALGLMFNEGFVEVDKAKAAKWFRMAAEQGDDLSQYELAELHRWGTGVVQDYAEALKWYFASAKQGYKLAQDRLGYMYKEHSDNPKSNLLAHMWYNIAAANGTHDSGRLRDQIASSMTNADISKAQAMARECMNSGYIKCGY